MVTTRSLRGHHAVTTRSQRDHDAVRSQHGYDAIKSHNIPWSHHDHEVITTRHTRLLRRLRRVYLVFLTLSKTCILKILIFLSCFMSCFGAVTAG